MRFSLALVIVVLIQSACTDEQAEHFAKSHIQERSIDGVEQMLLATCADQWCKPYARDAASHCVNKYLDFDALLEDRPDDVAAYLEPHIDDIHFCAIGKIHERYNQDHGKGT
ncbi:MAG: hypothetical protein AAF662_01400 [Pseudomonadota bacterium]